MQRGFSEVDIDKQNLNLNEAANRFLASLAPEKRNMSQQEIYKFVRWFGWEQPLTGLTPPEVANYAERLSLSDTSYMKKFELIRAFLTYASKKGWCKNNLATHFKTRLSKTKLPVSTMQGLPGTTPLTRQGYAGLEAELVVLKSKRSQVIGEIHRAAADKDFRENAPLDAAREERGHLEGRIKELEETLKSAIIIDEEQKVARKAGIGDSILLCEVASGEELRYMIVSPREADPIKGKISSASPIGKAVVGRTEDEVIEVAAPAGKLLYRIKEIKH
jgi:transcription elongation factor GreA